MKKMMMLMLGCVIGLAAQAAQVTWTATAIPQSGTSTAYAAFLVDASSTTLTSAEDVAKAIQKGTFDGSYLWNGPASFKSGVAAVAAANQALPATYGNGDPVSYYGIVFDAASPSAAQNYIVTGSGNATISAAGKLQLGNGSQAGKSWSSLGGGGDVPEPTSGLLLLVGGAILALRRKQK